MLKNYSETHDDIMIKKQMKDGMSITLTHTDDKNLLHPAKKGICC